MHWQFGVYSYTYFLTAAVTLTAAWINWRRRGIHDTKTPALPMLLVSLWAFFGGVELAAVGIAHKFFWLHLESIIGALVVCFLFLFVLQYYRREHWLTPLRYRLFWLPVVFGVLLMLSNPLHNWYWVGFEHGPTGSNLLFMVHGPAYYLTLGYYTLLTLLGGYILYCEITQSAGWERIRTLLIAISMLVPLGAFLTYLTWPDQTVGINLMPIGFSLCGLLISGVVYEDTERQVAHHTTRLEDAVLALHIEIDNRERLEAQLREARDSLATHLAQQSNNLAGLYSLILMANLPLEADELLEQALAKLQTLLRCDAICMHELGNNDMQLRAQRGMCAEAAAALQSLPADWRDIGQDVMAVVDTTQQPALGETMKDAGFGACMCKWVHLPDRVVGMLAVFWESPRQFAVEDIALFSALTDEFGVILENSRLRKLTAQAAILEERKRLARDLHDSVAQSLHSLAMSAETARQISQTHPDRLDKILSHLVLSAKQAVKEMRLMMYELRLLAPDRTSLVTALQHRMDGVERRAGLDARLIVENDAHWPKEWETELYPLALEALNNAIKHARASRVEVRLRGKGESFELIVSDDGCGFDPLEKGGRHGGMGMATMTERAERLGGRIEINSELNGGTRLTFLKAGAGAQLATHAHIPSSQVNS